MAGSGVRRALPWAAVAVTYATLLASADTVPMLSASGVAAVQHRLDRLTGVITGTAVQRDAGAFLRYEALNGGLKECLAHRGFPDTPVGFRPTAIGYRPHAASTTTFLAEPGVPLVSTDAISTRAERDEGATADFPGKGTRAFGEASNACHRTHPPRHGADSSEPTPGYFTPRGADSLWRELDSVIDDVDEDVGDADDYLDCMADLGDRVPAPRAGDLADLQGWARLREYLQDLVPRTSQIPTTHDARSVTPAWRAFLDREAELLRHDKTCRHSEYGLGMSMLASPVDDFVAEHRDELRSVAAGWDDVVARAEAAGFDASPYE